MTKSEFLKLTLQQRRDIVSKMNRKQLEKLCKAFNLNVHGGTFALRNKLETL